MTIDNEKLIYAKLAQMEADIAGLRDGYLIVNKRYTQTLESVKLLTQHTLEAAMRAALAAEKAALACKTATQAAIASANAAVVDATRAAAQAAGLSAVAASEAAAAASAAAAAAASAAAIQAEETMLQASAEAAQATVEPAQGGIGAAAEFERDADAPGDRLQVDHGVGRAAECNRGDDGVLEGRPRSARHDLGQRQALGILTQQAQHHRRDRARAHDLGDRQFALDPGHPQAATTQRLDQQHLGLTGLHRLHRLAGGAGRRLRSRSEKLPRCPRHSGLLRTSHLLLRRRSSV